MAAGHTGVGSIKAAQIRHARYAELRRNEGCFFFFTLAAIFRAKRTAGGQGLLQGCDTIGLSVKRVDQRLKRQRHGASFAAEDRKTANRETAAAASLFFHRKSPLRDAVRQAFPRI